MQDHDELFKELLTEFFFEFKDLFFPNVAIDLDRSFFHVMDKELYSSSGAQRTQSADLISKVWNKRSGEFFLIHLEIQSTRQSKFPERMYRYYSSIEAKYRLPILPIAVFTFKMPKQEQETAYEGTCAGLKILRFEFLVVQLNRYHWKSFIYANNPVASALMACMSYDNHERPAVKLECLRSLARSNLENKREIIAQHFIDTYLQLNKDERAIFEKKLAELNPKEEQRIMAYITSWQREGIAIGISRTVLKLLTRLHGALPENVVSEIKNLSEEKLSRLSDVLLDFEKLQDVIDWLKTNQGE